MEVNLTCPVHRDVVLFTEHLDRMELIVFGQTMRCHKCGKSYFKEQCQPKGFREDRDDDQSKG